MIKAPNWPYAIPCPSCETYKECRDNTKCVKYDKD